jgi:oligopeptidase A
VLLKISLGWYIAIDIKYARGISMSDQNVAYYAPKFDELNISYFKTEIPIALKNYKDKVQITKQNEVHSWDTSIQPLEEAAESLNRIWSQLEHLNAVANTPDIRATYDELLPIVTNFETEIMQDGDLYKIYLEIYISEDFKSLTDAQQIIITNAIRDFKLCGVDLAPESRSEFKRLAEELSDLENQFSNNLLDATENWDYRVNATQASVLAGLPKLALDIAHQKAKDQNHDGWIFTLDFPSYYAIMSNAKDRELRREFYYAYSTRASDQGPNANRWDNTDIINQILAKRARLAELAGYSNYVAYSLVPKMAKNLEDILQFLHNLIVRAKPKAEQEFKQLQDFATKTDNITQLEAWDIAYYSELFKIQQYEVSEEALRAYFPEPRVLTGLFKLVRTVFGLQIEELSGFQKWHPTVRLFKVLDKHNNLRGYFYTDLYARDGKRSGAWMSECISRMRFSNNLLQHPIAYLNCNFAPPVDNNPGLLTHDDVITLFHEFGHTLHHVLTQVDYYSAAGMNGVAWDAVELPSQFMENWCWQWDVIQDISENIKTGEPLPRAIFEKLLATKNFQSGMALMRQIEFTLFDLRIHAKNGKDQNKTVAQILDSVRSEVSVVPIPEFNRFQNSFGHIFAGGYAAGYYSYLWAEVLSCDAFAIFNKNNVYNNEVGNAFVTQILERGGSKPAMELFKAFAGREPEVDALLEHHAIA